MSGPAVPKPESIPWLSTAGLGDPAKSPVLSGLMSLSGPEAAWQGHLPEA